MRQILRLALNDLRLTVKDRTALIWLLLLPIAMMWFFGRIGGGGDAGPQKITLTVVDHDRGWLARSVVEQLEAEQVHLVEMTPDEAQAAEGKVRTLVIPEGFTEKVLAGEQQALRLEKEPDSNQGFGFGAQVHILRAIVRSLATLTEMEAASGGTGVDRWEEFARLAAREPLVLVDVRTAGTGTPVPAGTAQSVPGILTMTVLMMTVIYGGVFLTVEKQEGMLRRQASLPVSRTQIFLGKVLGRMLVAGMQIVPLVLAGRFLFGVSWGSSPVGLVLVLTAYAVAVAGLATLIGSVLSTPEQASSVGWILSMILAGLGGCWWPAEVMPGWARTMAHFFPTAWAMDAFHALISFGHGAEAVLLPSAMLLGFGALFAGLGVRFLRY